MVSRFGPCYAPKNDRIFSCKNQLNRVRRAGHGRDVYAAQIRLNFSRADDIPGGGTRASTGTRGPTGAGVGSDAKPINLAISGTRRFQHGYDVSAFKFQPFLDLRPGEYYFPVASGVPVEIQRAEQPLRRGAKRDVACGHAVHGLRTNENDESLR